MCTWICSVFISLEKYWWIGYDGSVPKFCFGSFVEILFWFLRGHSISDMGRTSVVHRGDFLGHETFNDDLCSVLFCSEWLNMQFTNFVRQYNIHRIPFIWLAIFYYVHFTSAYITYRVLYSHLYLNYRWYKRYLIWGRGADFLTAASVYEHLDDVFFFFLLRVLYSFWLYILGVNVWEAHWVWLCLCTYFMHMYIYIYEWNFLYVFNEFKKF